MIYGFISAMIQAGKHGFKLTV